jgi:hypothetical protein
VSGIVHCMKCLEFQAVAVIGVADGVVPAPNALTETVPCFDWPADGSAQPAWCRWPITRCVRPGMIPPGCGGSRP